MSGEKNLQTLLRNMQPKLNPGDFVFCTVHDWEKIYRSDALMIFKESESTTVILKKETADSLDIEYSYISKWITLEVHSSLEAVGLTAAFSKALAHEGISCNVVAAYYHDHIFVDKKDSEKAMKVLEQLSEKA